MKALIIGNGISGKSANKLLKKLGYSTIILDDKKHINKRFIERIYSGLSLLVVSPGVPKEHEIVKECKKRKIKVVGELELGVSFFPCDFVAISGTNGKTTTTTLTKELLNKNSNAFALGNIGVPVCSKALSLKPTDIPVLEVSSFQLESISYFAPHIACFLNITVDHLNRHKTMKNYIKAKMNIFKNQTKEDFAVLNLDDKILSCLDTSKIKSQIFYFSTKHKCKGTFVNNDKIFFNDGSKEEFIMSTSDIALLGEHNLSNVLAGILVAKLLNVDSDYIQKVIHNFKGVCHRLEYVAEVKGITYINDSKATNISSTLVAIKAMSEPTTLILGGSDKGFEFDELMQNLSPLIKNIVVVGETKQKIILAAKNAKISNVFEAQTFKEAVLFASNIAEKGEVVLLSPACASFDMFSSFEERGNVFKNIVNRLK